MEIYNVDNIVKVESKYEHRSHYFRRYIKKYGWPWNRKEKVMYDWWGKSYNENDLIRYLFEKCKHKDIYFKENGDIYEKAKVAFTFTDGSTYSIYCDNNKEANNIVKHVKLKHPNIQAIKDIVGTNNNEEIEC